MQLPDVSQWGLADWGIKAPLEDGLGLKLQEALLGSHGHVQDEAPQGMDWPPGAPSPSPTSPTSASP